MSYTTQILIWSKQKSIRKKSSREQDDNETLILIELLKYFALGILGSLEESLAKNYAADQLNILRSKVTRGEPSPKVKQIIAAMDVIFLKSVDTSSSFFTKRRTYSERFM